MNDPRNRSRKSAPRPTQARSRRPGSAGIAPVDSAPEKVCPRCGGDMHAARDYYQCSECERRYELVSDDTQHEPGVGAVRCVGWRRMK